MTSHTLELCGLKRELPIFIINKRKKIVDYQSVNLKKFNPMVLGSNEVQDIKCEFFINF